MWRGLNPGKKQLIIVFCSSDNTAEQIQACCLFVKGLILCFPLEKSFLGILRFFKKGQSGKMEAIMSLSHCISSSSTLPILAYPYSFLPLSYLLHRNLLGEVLIEINGDAVLPGPGSCSSCPSGRSLPSSLLVTFLNMGLIALSNQKVAWAGKWAAKSSLPRLEPSQRVENGKDALFPLIFPALRDALRVHSAWFMWELSACIASC